jgi:prevent-host-death family protein
VKLLISVTQAKAKLDELIDLALAGDEIVITKRGQPVARLVPVVQRRRQFGVLKGKLVIPDSFFDPLPRDELDAWDR